MTDPDQRDSAPGDIGQRPPWGWTAALLALALAPFALGLGSAYVYDDHLLVARQPLLHQSGGLLQLLGQSMWQGFGDADAPAAGYWRPAAAFLLWLGAQISSEPWPHELLQLAAHGGCVGLVWCLVRRLGLATPYAFAAALGFGWHPAHVENVAWVSGLSGALGLFFTLFSLERYAAWRARGSRGLPLSTAALFALALAAKESSVVLLLLVPAWDGFAPRALRPNGPGRGALGAYGLLLAVAALWIGLRMVVLSDPGAGVLRRYNDFGMDSARLLLLRLEIAGRGLLYAAWPLDVAHVRPVWPERGWTHPSFRAPLLAIPLFLALLVWIRRRGRSAAAFGLALWGAALLPLLARPENMGLFPASDRFYHLAALGAALVWAALLERLRPRGLGLALAAVLAIALSTTTARGVRQWDGDQSLWTAELRAAPHSIYPHWNLGRLALEDYRRERAPQTLRNAFEHFSAAQTIAERAARGEDVPFVSRDDVYQSNLGVAWCLIYEAEVDGFGDFSSAAQFCERLIEAQPGRAGAYIALAVARVGARDHAGAEAALRQAIDLAPNRPDAHHNLGQLLLQQGRISDGRRHLERALELRPGQREDLIWTARAYAEEGRTNDALELAARMRARFPMDPRPLVLEATLAARANQPDRALDLLERALVLDAEQAHAYAELGKVLLQLDRRGDALVALRRACEFGPELFEPHYNLAALLLEDGLAEAAAPLLERAYRLGQDPGLRSRLRGELSRVLPPGSPAELGLALVDLRRGDLGAAEAWIERRLAAHPDDVPALLLGAQIAEGQGRAPLALARLERGVELEPDAFQPRLELARFLERRDQRKPAADAYRDALSRLPEAAPGQEAGREALREELLGRIVELDR